MSSPPVLGTVLIVGGTGFLGTHLVSHFHVHPSHPQVHVLSRSPPSPATRHASATYHSASLTSPATIKALLARIKPAVIIHAASPDPFADPPNPEAYYRINVEGTATLLACAAESMWVRAFVYTSSTTVTRMDGRGECFLATEEEEIYSGPWEGGGGGGDAYYRSKGLADVLVRGANNPPADGKGLGLGCYEGRLATGTIRLAGTYGEGDMNLTWMCTELALTGMGRVQLGDNKGVYDPVYVGNAADAHVLLAEALIRGKGRGEGKVDGEAFNITDDEPVPFWDFARRIFEVAGRPQREDEVWVVPVGVIFVLAICAEWIYWVVFWGQRRPRQLQYQKIEFLVKKRSWSVEKAKKRLGYRPKFSTDEGVKRGVEWALKKWDEDRSRRRWRFPWTTER